MFPCRVTSLLVLLAAVLETSVSHAVDTPVGTGPTVQPASTAPLIPELAWEQRSDWLSVRTVQPAAVGDGVADDTAAVQAALNQMKVGSTIYFPPGRYRITKTLELPVGRNLGVSLLGHGRTSVLVWDGEAGGRMFWNREGLIVSRFVGLVWDGAGKAAVGFDHSAQKYFETEMRHQHEAFLNFTEAGIRVGHQQVLATAETLYDNCWFENCRQGVSIRSHNDLDHTFDRCEFRNCGIGVYGGKGSNFYIRNSHFSGSTEQDVVDMGETGSSLRNCTSHGSKQFVSHHSSVGQLVLESCHVAGWTSDQGAALLNGAPVLVFDCQFTASSSSSPVFLVNHGEQRLIFGQNQTTDCQLFAPNSIGKLLEIPSEAKPIQLPPATHSFLVAEPRITGKVFDAKRDFGAKGDGVTDDTEAIRKTIAAANAHGQNAIAYLPTGMYAVSSTLELTGQNFTFGGSGYRTGLLWKGPSGGTIIRVHDADKVTLENLGVGHHDIGVGDNAIDIEQTASSKPCLMTYDRVWTWGMYQSKPLERGMRLTDLGPNDQVLFKEFNGNLHMTDCADATIFVRLSYEGTFMVDGKSADRNGFIGGAVRLGTVTDPAIWVKDNQSLVLSDVYVESSAHHTRLEGDASLPAGRVTLQGAKFELAKPENNGLEVNNYRGELVLGPYQFYVGNPLHRFVRQGDAPFEMTLLGSIFYNSIPEFIFTGSNGAYAIAGIYTVGLTDDIVSTRPGPVDVNVDKALPQVVRAFADLRKLLAIDQILNSRTAQ